MTDEGVASRTGVDGAPTAPRAGQGEAAVEGTRSDSPGAGTPRTGRTRALRGSLVFLAGSTGALLLGSWHEALAWAVPVAVVLLMGAALGLLDALGLGFHRAEEGPAGARSLRDTWVAPLPGEPTWLAPQVTLPVAILGALGAAAVAGPGPLPLVLVAALLLLVPAALRRPALLVAVLALGLQLPTLGVPGLWDPWETHYAEVAREILARNDWISLWWAQEEWFWSKPVGIFWAEALSMRLFGVEPGPDAHPLAPEWAVRLPVLVTSLLATLAVYAAVARSFGRRAGVLASVVLITAPHFFALTRQAITDLPFLGHVAIALSLFLLAVQEDDPDREVMPVRLGPLRIGPRELAIGGIVMLGLPQVLYLVGRNLTVFPEGIAVHRDRFFSGSPGNADVAAGNPPLQFDLVPRYDGPLAQPAVQGLLWLLVLGTVVWRLRRERRAQPLLMAGFYVACALAFLGKGIPGFALPGLVALLFLWTSGRWHLLLDGRLRVGMGAGIVAGLGLPWFVAMVVRHGAPFLDRLLVHDHLKRLGTGVHGDKGSIAYFLEQLGYATFPWGGLALTAGVLALVWALRGADGLGRRVVPPPPGPGGPAAAPRELADAAFLRAGQREAILLVVLWLFATFTLFNAMVTKFHHYIAPVIPPAAVLVGLLLDRLWASGQVPTGPVPPFRRGVGILLAGAGGVALAAGLAAGRGDLRGVVPAGVDELARERWVFDAAPQSWVGLSLLLAGGLALVAAHRIDRGDDPRPWGRLLGLLPTRGQGWPRRLARLAVAVGLLVVGVWLGPPGLLTLGAALVAIAVLADAGTPRAGDGRQDVALAGAVVLAAAVLAFVGRDLSWTTTHRPQGNERLVQLFIYNYDRPFPAHLDYRPVLAGFGIAAVGLHGLIALRATRRVGVQALVGLAVGFAVWAVDVYLMDLSPHWSQRELIARYYDERGGPDEPLVAFQMNWKGENFYTGNRVHAFVDLDTRKLEEWLRGRPEGQEVFVLLEESRIPRLERALGAEREVEQLTDARLSNKFVLVRASPRPPDAPPGAAPPPDP